MHGSRENLVEEQYFKVVHVILQLDHNTYHNDFLIPILAIKSIAPMKAPMLYNLHAPTLGRFYFNR